MTQRHATVNAEDGVTNQVLLFTVACTSWQTLTWLQVSSSLIKPNILGASAKFRRSTISFVMSVCPSIPLCVCPFAWNNCTPCKIKLIIYVSTGFLFIHRLHFSTYLSVIFRPTQQTKSLVLCAHCAYIINFVIHTFQHLVIPSLKNYAPTGRTVLRKSLEKIHPSLQYENNIGYFT